MAIQHIMCKGIGFNPTGVRFIPTHGLGLVPGPELCVTATYSTSLTSAATFDITFAKSATYSNAIALAGTWDVC